nr:cytochrome P450 [Hoeflea marina]
MRLSPKDPGFYTDPYPAYAAIHARGPAIFWEEYGHWCFAGHDLVNRSLRERRFGRQILHVASRQELGWPLPKPHLADFDRLEDVSLLELEPPAHTRLRTLVNRAFVSRQVERLKPDIEALAHSLIDGFERDRHAELLASYGEIIPVTIIARMLGVPMEMTPQLLDWSHRMVRMYMFLRDEDIERDANAAARQFTLYLEDLIAGRRRALGDDLISHMLTARSGDDGLTATELVSTTILLLNAGHEATVHQIGNAVATILSTGADPKTMFADDRSTALAVEECMRFDPPLHMFTRWVLEDCEPSPGVTLRKGDRIGLMLGAANHDPARFPDPGSFRPDRDDGMQLAFGGGLHFCIGAPLARLELQVALPILFERLPALALAEPPRWRDAYHFRGLERLNASW